jgi:tryptophan synthase alpha chain
VDPVLDGEQLFARTGQCLFKSFGFPGNLVTGDGIPGHFDFVLAADDKKTAAGHTVRYRNAPQPHFPRFRQFRHKASLAASLAFENEILISGTTADANRRSLESGLQPEKRPTESRRPNTTNPAGSSEPHQIRAHPCLSPLELPGRRCQSRSVNRITERFGHLRQQGRKGLVIYIGAGDPDLEATRQLAVSFDRVGVDVLELGVPFSDPLADGLVNQLAAQRGLESGTTPAKVLATVAAIRQESPIPIVLYLYFNLIHHFGLERFIREASVAGVDGLLVLDLPPEESATYDALMRAAGLAAIYLVAPTTPEDRVATIVSRGSGFVYYVSREGVTGVQTQVSDTIASMTAMIRAHTDLPIAVGFGISNAEQAQAVAQHAEAVVVGSAVVKRIANLGRSPDLVAKVSQFVAELVAAVNSGNR